MVGVTMCSEPNQIRVACIQMQPEIGRSQDNLRASVELADDASSQGADLIILPELCNSGYMFSNYGEARTAAEDIPDGSAVSSWSKLCQDRGIYLVAGVSERARDRLFNSSVLIGPDGHIGTYRKVHLWNKENLYFEPGDLGFPVFDTPIGRISTLICYDLWFPEAVRACALRGADIVCVPTNWVPLPHQTTGTPAMATILCQANAHINTIYIAAADRVGIEHGQRFIGQSVIVSYTGMRLAGPASAADEDILYADVDFGTARSAHRWNDFNDPLRDRRPDIYAATHADRRDR